MLLVDDVDSKAFLAKLFNAMYDEFPFQKKSKSSNKISPSHQLKGIKMNVLILMGE